VADEGKGSTPAAVDALAALPGRAVDAGRALAVGRVDADPRRPDERAPRRANREHRHRPPRRQHRRRLV